MVYTRTKGIGAVADKFPYGRAPFWIAVVAILSGLVVLTSGHNRASKRPDLLLATFAPIHADAYREALPQFERAHGVRVKVQLVNWQALRGRLQNAMLAGSEVPDLVELSAGSMGYFTGGPLSDVGFVDLTERVHCEGLDTSLVPSRFSLWSSRGHIFALPHDVHPVMLAYRRDIVEKLGIDVRTLRTWDDFTAMGGSVTADTNNDGVVDRYAIDLPGGGWGLRTIMLQAGGGLFDENGKLTMSSKENASVIDWYVRQVVGPKAISFSCGWGQTLSKAMSDGLALFYIAPDWRTRQFQTDNPRLTGKMALMSLPEWPGGYRTSTMGGTGLAITRNCKRRELAWKLAKFLYLDKSYLGDRFLSTNIIPPSRDAWKLPEFDRPNEFYSGQPLGRLFAELAPEVPGSHGTGYSALAEAKLDEAYTNAARHYRVHGATGLRDFTERELVRCERYVARTMARNAFIENNGGTVGEGRHK